MAGISYDGLDDLLKDIDSIADIPDEVLDDMLDATGLPHEQLCTYCWDGRE